VEHASADCEYACARQNDALNKTFEPAEVNRFKTHTQGPSSYRLSIRPGYVAIALLVSHGTFVKVLLSRFLHLCAC
jgi:hypothetical protein